MLSESQLKKFERVGYLVVPNFLAEDQVASLEAARGRIVDELDPKQHQTSVFTTQDKKQMELRAKDEYFLTSGDKVRFFWEEESLDSEGNLKVEKSLAVNKIGHALHWLVPEFREVTFSEAVRRCCRGLGLKKPAVCQSMYIFKQPGIGGEVTAHQDSCFLDTDPPQALVGFWIALEDADLENGCLWFLPGSHRQGLHKRFVRSSESPSPGLVFEGEQPKLDPDQFVPVPVRRGDCVIINGLVQHRSNANRSTRSRHIYTFHVVDTENTTYSPRNWLQPSQELPFPLLYTAAP